MTAVQAALGSRPIVVAASTHAGEESLIIEAHRRLRGSGREKLLLQPVVTASRGTPEQNQHHEYQSKRTSA